MIADAVAAVDRWRDAEAAMKAARDERDAALVKARKQGVPLGELAAATGMQPARISDLAHGRRR